MRLTIFRSWLYLVARLLGDLSAVQRGRVGRRIGRRVAGKLTGRWFRRLFGAWLLLALVGALALHAAERIDLFDARGNRTGYAIVDREQGRVDVYDAQSRRTGWGRLTPTGRIEMFTLDGKRQGDAVMPLTTERRPER